MRTEEKVSSSLDPSQFWRLGACRCEGGGLRKGGYLRFGALEGLELEEERAAACSWRWRQGRERMKERVVTSH